VTWILFYGSEGPPPEHEMEAVMQLQVPQADVWIRGGAAVKEAHAFSTPDTILIERRRRYVTDKAALIHEQCELVARKGRLTKDGINIFLIV
jgi:hypothetical protein